MKLSKAAQEYVNDPNALLRSDGPVQLAKGDQSNGVSHPTGKASRAFELDASGKAANTQPGTPPGSDAELQELIKDSPFLDFDSPMTPYEWLKFVVMVRLPLLPCCMNRLVLHANQNQANVILCPTF